MNALTNLRYASAIAILLVLQFASIPIAAAEMTRAELIALVPVALSPDSTIAQPARAQLRAAGPVGLDALFVAQSDAIKAMRSKLPAHRTETELRLREAIEFVAQQRDVEYSQLYWFTDLASAKAEAQRLNRPILSLRMLGKLTEELSCANSRFFRTSLYSNPAIADLMRKRFVLHWSAERPVPKMTIDFGDGRTLSTTVTGNSIHYILDSKGRAFDGLPGLYTPFLFKKTLEQVLPDVLAAGAMPLDSDFLNRRAAFHRAAAQSRIAEIEATRIAKRPPRPRMDDAIFSTAVPTSKLAWETPLISGATARKPSMPTTSLSSPLWSTIAPKLAAESSYEPAARELMLRKFAMPSGIQSALKESDKTRLLEKFFKTAHVEAVRNEYATHTAIHQYLESSVTSSLEVLNERVYTTLFEMPRTDPWLGLLAEETFSGIEGYGLEVAGGAKP